MIVRKNVFSHFRIRFLDAGLVCDITNIKSSITTRAVYKRVLEAESMSGISSRGKGDAKKARASWKRKAIGIKSNIMAMKFGGGKDKRAAPTQV